MYMFCIYMLNVLQVLQYRLQLQYFIHQRKTPPLDIPHTPLYVLGAGGGMMNGRALTSGLGSCTGFRLGYGDLLHFHASHSCLLS